VPSIWTRERVAKLHRLFHAANDAQDFRQDMARQLGVTMFALIARLGREYRAGTLIPKMPQRVNKPKSKRVRKRNHVRRPRPPRTPEGETPIPPWTPPEIDSTLLTPAPPGSAARCQWPLWANDVPRVPKDPKFCALPCKPGYSFCPEHCRIAFARVSRNTLLEVA